MKDPITAGGSPAIRYALPTTPALIAMPVALLAPVGDMVGSDHFSVTGGFTASVLFAFGTEYVRRGSLYPHGADMRARWLGVLSGILRATPVLSVIAFLLGIVAVSRCGGATCSDMNHVVTVMGLVFAIIASLGSMALVSMLRSPVWAQHVAASREGQ